MTPLEFSQSIKLNHVDRVWEFTRNDIISFAGDNEFLSNFYMHPVRFGYEGISYPSVEHAFQAAKTLDVKVRREISRLDKPSEAKAAGRNLVVREDWEQVKNSVMAHLIAIKFAPASDLLKKLKDTGRVTLIEGNRWYDAIWGCSWENQHDKTFLKRTLNGQNRLGQILMLWRNLQDIKVDLDIQAPRKSEEEYE